MTSCPRWDGHGSGPFPGGRCYGCAKAAILAGEPTESAELRVFAGFPDPRPRDRRWVPADRLPWPEVGPLERPRSFEASESIRALVQALRRVGEDGS